MRWSVAFERKLINNHGLRDFFRLTILGLLFATITAVHYLTDVGFFGLTRLSLHNIHYLLYFLPILIGAIWYGLVGGIATALIASILYIPGIFGPMGANFAVSVAERVLELVMYNAVGFVTGLLAYREQRERMRLLRTSEELQKTKYLATVGQMVATVAHDVRNPLQNIQLGVDVIRAELGSDQRKLEVLEGIDRGVSLLKEIVTELLDYSKPIEIALSSTSTNALLSEALSAVENKLSSIAVHLDLEQADREITVDPARLHRVLVNLISNAAEAMPEGGDLRIRSQFHESNGAVKLGISIADTGSGIDEETLERVSEPFFTTKPHGTGLGVLISRKIIEAHEGSLDIESKVGRGTTVEIMVPAQNQRKK